jgi:hypothetical protein
MFVFLGIKVFNCSKLNASNFWEIWGVDGLDATAGWVRHIFIDITM